MPDTAFTAADPADPFAALRPRLFGIAELSFAIAVINAWNLLSVSLRNPLPA